MLPRVQSYKRKENMLTHYNLDNLMVQCLSGTYFNLIQYMHPRININKNVENIYFMMLIVMLNSSYDYITDKFDKHKMTPKFIENILDITCVLGQYNLFKYYLPDDISNIDIRKQIYLLNYHVQWGNGYLKLNKVIIHSLSLRGLQYVTKTDEKILSTKKCSMYACTKYMYEAQTIMNTTQENTSCIYQIYDDFKIYICDTEDSDDDV